MAKITPKEVLHIAKLSKLDLKSSEIEGFSRDLSSIINYIEQLSEIETKDIESLFNVTELNNVVRQDQVIKSNITWDQIKLNAPEIKEGSIVVPGIF